MSSMYICVICLSKSWSGSSGCHMVSVHSNSQPRKPRAAVQHLHVDPRGVWRSAQDLQNTVSVSNMVWDNQYGPTCFDGFPGTTGTTTKVESHRKPFVKLDPFGLLEISAQIALPRWIWWISETLCENQHLQQDSHRDWVPPPWWSGHGSAPIANRDSSHHGSIQSYPPLFNF